MTEFCITNAGDYTADGVNVSFVRGECANPEHLKATLSVSSLRGIHCVLVKCEATKSVIAHETYNGTKIPPVIEFLETEEYGPYIVEVS